MAAQTVPELALSESDEHDVNDLGEGPLSGDFREVEYDPSHVWIEDPDDPMEPPPALSQWDKNGWDDTALVSVWAAATEEFIVNVLSLSLISLALLMVPFLAPPAV